MRTTSQVANGVRRAPFLAAGLLAVVVAITLGGRLPTARVLPTPPPLRLDLTRDGRELAFPQVTLRFLTDALGPDASAFLPTAPGAPASTPLPPSSSGPTGPGGGPPSPGPTSNPTPSPSPGPLPTLLHFPRLTVALTADRTEVPPGGTITYRVVVTNVGNETFHGTYQSTAHIPFGTVDATTPCGGTLGVDPQHGCVSPPVPVPGSPDSSTHQENSSFTGTLAPGRRRVTAFMVRVNETTEPGTRLSDHAHVDVLGDGKPPATSHTVVVVVRGGTPVRTAR